MTTVLKYPITCPINHIPEVNVCGDAHTRYCPVHGDDLWYDTCWGCYGPVRCQACMAWSNRKTGLNTDRWVQRTTRIVGMRIHCVDPSSGKNFKLEAWGCSLPAAMRRFAAHARRLTFLGT